MQIDLSPLEKALASLEEVLALPVTPIIRDSAIQRFEYTYELAIKLLKRILEASAANPGEIDTLSFRDIIRIAAEQGLIQDPQSWFVYRRARNDTSHAYNESKAIAVYDRLAAFTVDARQMLEMLQKRSGTL